VWEAAKCGGHVAVGLRSSRLAAEGLAAGQCGPGGMVPRVRRRPSVVTMFVFGLDEFFVAAGGRGLRDGLRLDESLVKLQ